MFRPSQLVAGGLSHLGAAGSFPDSCQLPTYGVPPGKDPLFPGFLATTVNIETRNECSSCPPIFFIAWKLEPWNTSRFRAPTISLTSLCGLPSLSNGPLAPLLIGCTSSAIGRSKVLTKLSLFFRRPTLCKTHNTLTWQAIWCEQHRSHPAAPLQHVTTRSGQSSTGT